MGDKEVSGNWNGREKDGVRMEIRARAGRESFGHDL